MYGIALLLQTVGGSHMSSYYGVASSGRSFSQSTMMAQEAQGLPRLGPEKIEFQNGGVRISFQSQFDIIHSRNGVILSGGINGRSAQQVLTRPATM